MMRAVAILGGVSLLASCASAPVPTTQTVQVPVPVPCVNNAPGRPTFEFDKLPATASDGDKILALVRDWARYRKYTGELEAIVAGCK
ncbi:hypothetical protein [Duganella sp.]|uniref:hypothetical protein n=1 Tax=Duganella sp. TaxID=1904440 RepID=UPI0031D5435A